MSAIRFELAWPSKQLSPNVRSHWAQRSPRARKAREDARLVCQAAANRARFSVPPEARVRIDLWGVPAKRRARDKDNFLSSCKAYLDGISDALGINDVRFDPVPSLCEPASPARVIVTVSVEQ